MRRYCWKSLAKKAGVGKNTKKEGWKKYKKGGWPYRGEIVYRKGVQTFCALCKPFIGYDEGRV